MYNGKKVKGPRRKRMKRTSRVQHVKNTKWLEKYEGKNLIKGYCKRFCVDELCALTEMEMLGYKVSGKERQKAIKAMEARKMQKLKKKEKRERKQKQYEEIYSDEPFYFIAGYTENGVPFGITHKEMETDLSETAQKNNENGMFLMKIPFYNKSNI